MKLALQITAAGLSTLFLASCGSTGTASSSRGATGPFDSRGNYVEDWADSPSKWKKGSAAPSKPGEALVMTSPSDEPPPNSVPIPTAGNTRTVADIGSAPVVVASRKKSVEESPPSSSRGKTVASAAAKPKSRAAEREEEEERPKSKTSSSTAAASKPKAKSETAAKTSKTSKTSKTAKATPPPKKSVTTRYTVKKGDTLSGIASRFGTSVGALKSANGISGSVIQPGKSLVVSKR